MALLIGVVEQESRIAMHGTRSSSYNWSPTGGLRFEASEFEPTHPMHHDLRL